MDKLITDLFGEWTKTPSNWIGAMAAIIAASVAGAQAASNLSDPLIRWGAPAMVLILCLGALYFGGKETTSPKVTGEEKEAVKSARPRTPYVWGALCSFVFLAADMSFHLSGLMLPIEVRDPTFQANASLMLQKEDAERLAGIPVVGLQGIGELTQQEAQNTGAWKSRLHSTFELKKKNNVDEAIIEDAVLLVEKYEPFPPNYSQTLAATISTMTVFFFELKKKDEPLPWRFRPQYIFQDGKVLEWSPGLVSLRDNFVTPFMVKPYAVDAGIYHIRLLLTVNSRFGRDMEVPLMKQPVALGFYDKKLAARPPGVTFANYSGGPTVHEIRTPTPAPTHPAGPAPK
jgi:hypothetical protein